MKKQKEVRQPFQFVREYCTAYRADQQAMDPLVRMRNFFAISDSVTVRSTARRSFLDCVNDADAELVKHGYYVDGGRLVTKDRYF